VETARNLKRAREVVVAGIPLTVRVITPEEAVKLEELIKAVEVASPFMME
jgi:hypothetical protein